MEDGSGLSTSAYLVFAAICMCLTTCIYIIIIISIIIFKRF